jgi:hypothetical protein
MQQDFVYIIHNRYVDDAINGHFFADEDDADEFMERLTSEYDAAKLIVDAEFEEWNAKRHAMIHESVSRDASVIWDWLKSNPCPKYPEFVHLEKEARPVIASGKNLPEEYPLPEYNTQSL